MNLVWKKDSKPPLPIKVHRERNLIIANRLNIFSALLPYQSSDVFQHWYMWKQHRVHFLGRGFSNTTVFAYTMSFCNYCQHCLLNMNYLLPDSFKILVLSSCVSSIILWSLRQAIATNVDVSRDRGRSASFPSVVQGFEGIGCLFPI